MIKALILLISLLAITVCAEDLAKAKADFAKADKELNEAWAALKSGLVESEFAEVREDQRGWVEYRDFLAKSPVYNGVSSDKDLSSDSIEYLRSAADLTRTRTEWLRGRIRFKDDETVTGVWGDSYGGRVEVVEKEGKLWFSISVVRGHSLHLGDISGAAQWNSPLGWYSDKGIVPDKDGGETNLAFVLRGQVLEIVGANTSFYHGARAYFDGRYIKVGVLDAKAQAELIKEASSPD